MNSKFKNDFKKALQKNITINENVKIMYCKNKKCKIRFYKL